MSQRLSLILMVCGISALSGCHDKSVEPAAAVESRKPVAVDPAAPAPGSQAAEAIGADSSGDAPASAH